MRAKALPSSGVFVISVLFGTSGFCGTCVIDCTLLTDGVLLDFGGLYLCLIRQPSKQNLALNLYGRRELDLFSKPSSQDFHLNISLKKETRRTQQRLAQRGTLGALVGVGPCEDQKHNCRRAEQD
jgi:hypothetical protein